MNKKKTNGLNYVKNKKCKIICYSSSKGNYCNTGFIDLGQAHTEYSKVNIFVDAHNPILIWDMCFQFFLEESLLVFSILFYLERFETVIKTGVIINILFIHDSLNSYQK